MRLGQSDSKSAPGADFEAARAASCHPVVVTVPATAWLVGPHFKSSWPGCQPVRLGESDKLEATNLKDSEEGLGPHSGPAAAGQPASEQCKLPSTRAKLLVKW